MGTTQTAICASATVGAGCGGCTGALIGATIGATERLMGYALIGFTGSGAEFFDVSEEGALNRTQKYAAIGSIAGAASFGVAVATRDTY